MKILDRNYRLFGVVNPVDLLVALLILAVVSVGYFMLRGGSAAGSRNDAVDAEVMLLVREMRDVSLNIEVGDEMIKTGIGTIGHVASVTERPSTREVPTADGELKVVDSTLFTEAIIVVEGEGRLTDAGAVVGDVLVAANELIEVKTPRFSAKATVMSVELAE